MANTVQKTIKTATPRKAAIKKVKLAEADIAAASKPQGIAPQAKAEAADKVAAKTRKTAPAAQEVTQKAATPAAAREEIEYRAYCYWAERGFQHGSALQDWLRAEYELQLVS
jgi:hypothetical protein